MTGNVRRIRELLERIRKGPLQDPELLQITLEYLIRRSLEDTARVRREFNRRHRQLQDDELFGGGSMED